MRLAVAYLVGLIFGVGISLSGMSNPAKVLNFFDVAGSWDPSLGFVMGGAVLISFFGYRSVLSRSQPLFEPSFSLPTRTNVDMRLASGALIFGIGWGLAGFCPGGALPAVGTGNKSVLLFVLTMTAGIIITRQLDSHFSSKSHTPLGSIKR